MRKRAELDLFDSSNETKLLRERISSVIGFSKELTQIQGHVLVIGSKRGARLTGQSIIVYRLTPEGYCSALEQRHRATSAPVNSAKS